MNCRNCGAPVTNGAQFCAGCGQTVKESSLMPAVNPFEKPVQQEYNPPQQQGYQQGYAPQNQQPYNGGYAGGFGDLNANHSSNQNAISSLKRVLLFFMAIAVFLSALGILNFPYIKETSESDFSDREYVKYSYNNEILKEFKVILDDNDGNIVEVLEELYEDNDESLSLTCFLLAVVMTGLALILAIIAYIISFTGTYSTAMGMLNTSLLLTAVGYLAVIIESIAVCVRFEEELHSENYEYAIAAAPCFMLVVTLLMFFTACSNASKIAKADK